ncbi:uncharacterized protein C6G9.01c-like [Prosopis cineraria]|uniref:uncharacterized protein C6G9.01c-like n=1 Tax=Prosopis cineraria TaxID=364024 RepID=UPI00240E9F69|nr:uncharacterized protein C6G9.01c-like [Prosopis cineraria]
MEEQKPSSAQKKQGSEIDEIFGGKKRKKPEAEKTEKSADVTKRPKKIKKNMKKKTKRSDAGDFADPPSRPRKTTDDGLAIFSEEELGINRADAGNTPLCPFDCSCCF